MREKLKTALPSLAGLILFLLALEVLRHELAAVSWHTLTTSVMNTPRRQLLSAFVLTVLGYAVLTGYDFLALASIGKQLPVRTVIPTSFFSYAVTHNVGFAVLSGASVRYRFYGRFGITPGDLSRIVFSLAVTFWIGLLTLGGLSLALGYFPQTAGFPAAGFLAPIGWLLTATAPAYVVLSSIRKKPIRIRNFEIPLPPPRLAFVQVLISIADWVLAAAVVFSLLPRGSVPFGNVIAAFLGAQLLGLFSHVPGGVGVFEGLMVLLLKPYLDSASLLPALIAFRAIYYLLPLSIAIIGLVVDEVRERRAQAAYITAAIARVSKQFTPWALAVFTFTAGLMLLFSGATPVSEARLAVLDRILPLGVLETSHFLGSVTGAALLLLSHGLARRLDAAYWMASAGLVVGVATSVLKGGGYAEGAFLLVVLLLLVAAKGAFYRKAALFDTRFSAAWIASVIAAVLASIWLGFFAFKHVEYSSELWWQFELYAEASRFLRASVGASIAVLLFAAARLLGFAPHAVPDPTEADLAAAELIVSRHNETRSNLVYLKDKAILFDEERTGFVMYGVQGRTWVALGDPVCDPSRIPEFIRLFLDHCDDFGGTPVFYEVRKENMHHYVDFGLTLIKAGEEAIVDLQQFSLEGPHASRLRQAYRRLEKDNVAFRVLTPVEAAPRMDELETVSRDWLEDRPAEKGFSLGSFDRSYLSRFPIAVIETEGRIVAFANVWESAGKEELSVDLMRYHHDAPKGIMEPLFVHTLMWGKEQGYAR
ncbi:MAG TPA: bifunctional lysylphosphatidylglycerol flippase/synthetase MprF, partial [Terriglobia bacterium]|nr:bifunctional lysylphosphatidylglycerol flippase/synthetase MprF [Terriglobia bacterium]